LFKLLDYLVSKLCYFVTWYNIKKIERDFKKFSDNQKMYYLNYLAKDDNIEYAKEFNNDIKYRLANIAGLYK